MWGGGQACAGRESSKQFAKEFMTRHRIPTAEFSSFDAPSAAHAYIEARGTPIVVKADGLAAGKGVIRRASADEAHPAGGKNLPERPKEPTRTPLGIEQFLQAPQNHLLLLPAHSHLLPPPTIPP